MFDKLKKLFGSNVEDESLPAGVVLLDDFVRRCEEIVTTAVLIQVPMGELEVDPKNWGVHDKTVLGYIAGMSQALCHNANARDKTELLAIRAAGAIFRDAMSVEALWQRLSTLEEQRDVNFMAAANAGVEDANKLSHKDSWLIGLAKLLRAE